MIFSLPTSLVILSISLFSLVNSSTINTAGSDEGYKITRTSTAHRYGQVRPVEEEQTASVREGYGHRYVPGQNQPPLVRTTAGTIVNSQTVTARQVSSPLIYPSYAPFVYDLNATATTLTTRTGVRSFSGSIAYTPSSAATSGAGSSTLDYQSVTISSAQISSSGTQLPLQTVTSIMSTTSILMSTLTIGSSPAVSPSPFTTVSASVTATGVAGGPPASSGIISELASLTGLPWTLPPCQGPSPGPGLTPVGCTFANSESTPLPTTTYSWSEVANITAGSKPTSYSLLKPSAPNLNQNQSQTWTSDSVPCSGNSSYECAVNGTSTITLGLISQILGLEGATRTPVAPPGTGNLPPNWAENLTRCAGNTNMACLVISSSTTTLGPIAQATGNEGQSATSMPLLGNVNASQSWTSNSKPCANDSSWECVDTPSGVASLAPIASLKYTELSTSDSMPCANNKSLECVVNGSSTITLGLISLLTSALSSSTSEAPTNSGLLSTILSELGITRQSSTTSNSVAAATSPGTMSTSSLAYSSKTVSSTSSSGGSTITTSISVAPSPTPCGSNNSMECLVNGESTFTAEASHKTSSKVTSGVVTVTTVSTTSLPTPSTESSPTPHNPYPYPSVQSSSAKSLKVPLFLILFCSLVSMANSIGLSVFKDPPSAASSSSTDILYAPLVSSIAEILAETSVEPDGDWGIGVPPATTSSLPQNGQYGSGQPTSPGATSSSVNNGQSGGGGQSKSSGASPASASVTRAIIQASTFSPFPTNFIQPVTDDNTNSVSRASQTTSSPPVSSTTAKSGAFKVKVPFVLLLLCSLTSLVTASIAPSPRSIKISSNANPTFSTWDLSNLPIIPTTEVATSTSQPLTIIPITYSDINPSFPTWNLSNLPAPPTTSVIAATTTSVSSVTDDNPMPYMTPCISNTSIACVVAGGLTFTNGLPPTTLQSTPSTASTTPVPSASTIPVPALSTIPVLVASTVPASVTWTILVPTKTATSDSSRVKIPSLFVLLNYLVSQAKAQQARSTTTSTITSQQPTLTSVMHMGSPIMVSANVTMPITPETSAGSSRQVPNFLLLARVFIADTWERLISRSQQPTLTSAIQMRSPIGVARDETLPVSPPTSGGSGLKVPRFLLLAHSFAKDSWAKLIPRYPTVEEQAAQARAAPPSLEFTSEGSPKIVEADTAMPVMPAANGASSLKQLPSFFLVVHALITDTWAKLIPRYPTAEEQAAAQARSSPSSPASTSQGLKSIAAPFLVLIICCVAAAFYSVGLGRRKHKSGDEGYDSGWVVQRGEYVDREIEERKDH